MKLFKLQKRAAWIILEANTRSNSVKLFKELAWLHFYGEVKLNKSILELRRSTTFQSECDLIRPKRHILSYLVFSLHPL